MSELFLFYATTLLYFLGIAAFYCVYRFFLGNKLVDQAAKLKSQIAKIRQDFPELEQKRSSIVAGALGDIGIEGIMSELGIDPGILKNPLVRGLVDKYAPRVLEQLSKKKEGNEQENKVPFM